MSGHEVSKYLSVGELAKRVRRLDEDLVVTIDRLRNWTKEGWLMSGHKHPGTGKHHYYDGNAVFHALLLSSLTSLGIRAGRANEIILHTNHIYNENGDLILELDGLCAIIIPVTILKSCR